MSSPVLSLLGIAKKAGRLELGEEPVGSAARARQARLILVAADAAENSRRRAAHFAQIANIPWMELPFTKAELGQMTGRSTCAMAALTDAGFAAAIAAKLAAGAPEYREAAEALEAKAHKVHQRQKEQRVHEKRLREGRAKPWAAPPAKPDGAPPKGKAPGAPRPVPKGKIQVKGKLPRGPKPS